MLVKFRETARTRRRVLREIRKRPLPVIQPRSVGSRLNCDAPLHQGIERLTLVEQHAVG